jgi:pyruvate,orthophosphate dikinase
MRGFDGVIADMFAPLLEAAGSASFAVRAIDFMADEAMELLDSTNLFAQCPRLALPLGIPELIAAQVTGLGAAVRRVGYPGAAHLTVRHVVDPGETAELRRIADAEAGGGRPVVPVGATLTSLRGVGLAAEMARSVDVIWLEIRGLQSALFGYPARILLTGEPLDGYIQRHLISTDPRTSLDPSMMQLIALVGATRLGNPKCTFGVRLSGSVSEELAAAVYCSGFRVVAVDAEEVRPARLAFGKAAFADV